MNIAPLPFDTDAAALENSRPIRWDRQAPPELEARLLAHFLPDLVAGLSLKRGPKADFLSRLQVTLTAMALDLFVAAVETPESYVAVSLDSGAYAESSRYGVQGITYRAARRCVEYLAATGHVEMHKGFLKRGAYEGLGNLGRRTRLRATAKFMQVMDSAVGISLPAIRQRSVTETIWLKGRAASRGQAKPLLEYEDNDHTNAMRDRLACVNALLAKTTIALGGNLGAEGEGDALNLAAVQLRRVFNNGSFSQGGRFYGGFWQAMPSDQRSRLRLNGEPVVELDFASMHPRLCYHLEGHPLPADGDAYTLEGLAGATPRSLIKRAFGQLLNGGDGRLRQPPEAKGLLPKGLSWGKLTQAVEERHQLIRGWLRCNRGLELQALDADIADMVLHALAVQGIPCLPVHDSFLVQRSAEAALGETMILAYSGQMSRRTAIKALPVIRGWSSPAIEAAVMDRMSLWVMS